MSMSMFQSHPRPVATILSAAAVLIALASTAEGTVTTSKRAAGGPEPGGLSSSPTSPRSIPGASVEGFGYPQEPKSKPFPLYIFFGSSKIKVRARATGEIVVKTNDSGKEKSYPFATARAKIDPKDYPNSVLAMSLRRPGDESKVRAAFFTEKYDVRAEAKVVVHGGGRTIKSREKLDLG